MRYTRCVKLAFLPFLRAPLRVPGLAALVLAAGCSGLQLTAIKSAERKPSNVAVYFKVRTGGGDPVGGLTAQQFHIYEDGQLVSQYESKQTILNPEVAASHYTLLLVDMSGSVSESGNAEAIVQAVSTFTDRVEKQQHVGIYAFDGGPDLYPIVPFTDQAGNAKAGARQLGSFKPKDPSTNLNGAVVKALDELDHALAKAPQPLKFGTLVVFTDGTDRANRVPADTMLQRVRDKPFDVFAIGLGAEIKSLAAGRNRQERNRHGGRQDGDRHGVRRRRRQGRGAHEELLFAVLLFALARRPACRARRGRLQGPQGPERADGKPVERLRCDGVCNPDATRIPRQASI